MAEHIDKLDPFIFSRSHVREYDPAAPLASRIAAIEAGLKNVCYTTHRVAANVREEILACRRRSSLFEGIDDGGWQMMLQIYLAEHAGMTPMLGSMIRSADIGYSAAEAVLPTLVAKGWIIVSGLDNEPWLASVELTDRARLLLEDYFTEAAV